MTGHGAFGGGGGGGGQGWVARGRTRACAVALAGAASLVAAMPAWADLSKSTTIQVSAQGIDFAITVNGLPVVARHGVSLASVPYVLEPFFRAGDNLVEVTTTAAPHAVLQLVVNGPAANLLADAPVLGRAGCGAASPQACQPAGAFRFTIARKDAPDLHLWHAAAPGPDAAAGIARALSLIRARLLTAMDRGDWQMLFDIDTLRGEDLAMADGSAADIVREMAGFMVAARTAHPGPAHAGPDAAPADLVLRRLPANLVAVTRRDGAPVLDLRLGDGHVPGAAGAAIDPRDSGDDADRFVSGRVVLQQAIFGFVDGRWQLLR